VFDHISLAVTDVDRAQKFYDAALAPLGIKRGQADRRTASYELAGRDDFTLIFSATPPVSPHGTHICFRADTPDAVRSFHQAGVEAGGVSDGEPGLRPEYSSTYYAAFLVDPDGYRIEAVCHLSKQQSAL
jgi:catechol 2,3-dioxygenase-like lactoylglutathione lyase family enzyme